MRRALAARAPGPDTDLSAVEGALPVFLGTLADQCRELPGGELTSKHSVLIVGRGLKAAPTWRMVSI